MQDSPACGGDFGNITFRFHLREQHQPHRVAGVEGNAMFSEQTGEPIAQRLFRLAGEAAASHVDAESIPREPDQSVQSRGPASPPAFLFMDHGIVMVDRHADN